MKNLVRLTLALCALALASPASAQQARSMLGFGISVVPLDGGPMASTVELYLPIRVAPAFRLEPSLGVYSRDVSGAGTDHRDITLGRGAFFLKAVATPVDMYVGGRVKLNFAHVSTTSGGGVTVSDSGTDFSLAAALGGE